MKVKNFEGLKEAIRKNESTIELENSISVPESLHLNKGQKILATKDDIFLSFINGDGIAIAGDNEVSNLAIQTAPNRRAIFIDSSEDDLGEINLNNLIVTGVVQLLTRTNNSRASIKIDNLDIIFADARAFAEKPLKYGVSIYEGALTVYNFNPKEGSLITLDAQNIKIGRKKAPVIGSGILISGFNDEVGKVEINKLSTSDIYSNGMIPTGQPNLITGGIFISYGAHANEIISEGSVTTYGTNDMVLDVWGTVDKWEVEGKITSFGPSAIGFVNFGTVKNFVAKESIKTFGLGARGFNQYDGTIEDAFFEEIITEGDGSIGMQFSRPVGKIKIGKNISTKGSTGKTLVKGEIKELAADGISVLKDAVIDELVIGGDIVTHGDEVVSYHIDNGEVKSLKINGEILTKGNNSQKVVIENNGKTDTKNIEKYIN